MLRLMLAQYSLAPNAAKESQRPPQRQLSRTNTVVIIVACVV
jgi:hypothetical protein